MNTAPDDERRPLPAVPLASDLAVRVRQRAALLSAQRAGARKRSAKLAGGWNGHPDGPRWRRRGVLVMQRTPNDRRRFRKTLARMTRRMRSIGAWQ